MMRYFGFLIVIWMLVLGAGSAQADETHHGLHGKNPFGADSKRPVLHCLLKNHLKHGEFCPHKKNSGAPVSSLWSECENGGNARPHSAVSKIQASPAIAFEFSLPGLALLSPWFPDPQASPFQQTETVIPPPKLA